MRSRWIIANGFGEALGIAGVALAYAASGRGLVPEAPAVLAAGAWEGACLGVAQAVLLRSAGIRAGRWAGATVVVAVLGYAGSLAAAGGGGGAAEGAAPALALLLVGAAVIGALLGIVMESAQGWAAGGRIGRRAWIGRNAVGWALAMPAIFAGSALVGDTWPLAAIGAAGAVSGAVAGALLGAATAPALPAISAGS